MLEINNYKKTIKTISIEDKASQALAGLSGRYRLTLPAPVKAPTNAAIIFYAGLKGITSEGNYSLYLEVVNAFALYFLFTGTLDKARFGLSQIYGELVNDIQFQSPATYNAYLATIESEKIPEDKKGLASALLEAGDYSRLKPYLCNILLDNLTSVEVITQAEAARKILFAPGTALQEEEEDASEKVAF